MKHHAPLTPRARTAALVCGAVVVVANACLFLPAIEDDGYVACTSEADCGAGLACATEVGLCAPPVWNDTSFTQRRLITVKNTSDQTMPAGTTIPIRVGGDNATIALEDVAADARFTDFDEATAKWRVVGVYRDLFDDRFTVWTPLSRELGAGATDVLVWLEQNTEAGTPTVLETPADAFALFDDLDDFPTDEVGGDTYFINAPGAAAPIVGAGEVTVGDNVALIWRQSFVPPIEVTIRARVNGLNCDEVTIGLTGDDSVGFNPPSAVFFIGADLSTVAEIAPLATSNPTALSPPRLFSDQPNALHRFTVQVDADTVRLLIDDVLFDERTDLRPAFDPEAPLFPTVSVGGACSIDVDAVWASALPARNPPVVSAGAPVDLNLTF